jgi:hypothetical protein
MIEPGLLILPVLLSIRRVDGESIIKTSQTESKRVLEEQCRIGWLSWFVDDQSGCLYMASPMIVRTYLC